MAEQHEVIVVGGGPAGLTAGIFLRARGLPALILEAKQAGGQLVTIYPQKEVYRYPGIVGLKGKEFAQRFIDHAVKVGCEIREGEQVEDIERKEEGFLLRTASGNEYEAKAVIVATGMGLFEPRKLGAEGEAEFTGKGVYYGVEDIEEFRGKKTLVVGGGDTAVEMATLLAGVTDTTIIHRRDYFRAGEDNVERLEQSGAKKIMKSVVKKIFGDDRVRGVVIENVDTKEQQELQVDAVVMAIGYVTNVEPLKRWGLELEGNYIKVDTAMRTNVPGIFACGDAVEYDGKRREIVTACGEAATAAISAYVFLKKPYWA